MERQVASCLANSSQTRVETVWNQVDTERFVPNSEPITLRRRLGLEPLEKHICIIAALQSHKGHVCFLQAAKSILNRFPRATFHIVGSATTDSERHAESLRRLAGEMQISEQVRFWGFAPDDLARDILCASDLFILPTQEEGFGLSIAEAQSCEIPVLTSAISPLDEVVDDGRTGYLISPKDYKGFANRAIELLACNEARKEMGRAGRQWVLNRFSRHSHVQRITALYREIMLQPR
jgi:glycosyltransferase involved in cell wall biosynthesis